MLFKRRLVNLEEFANRALKEGVRSVNIVITEHENKNSFMGLFSSGYAYIWIKPGEAGEMGVRLRKIFNINNRVGYFFQKIIDRANLQKIALEEAIKITRKLLWFGFQTTINGEPTEAAEAVLEKYNKHKCYWGVYW